MAEMMPYCRRYLWTAAYCLFEEKSTPNELKQAEHELHQKFAKISQYSHIPYVIGVAIAGNKVSFQTIGSMYKTVKKVSLNLADAKDSARGFCKIYKEMSSSSRSTLCNFYKATKHTRFVEKAKVCPSDEQKLKLQQIPVGETRLPTTVLETKVAMKYILLALKGCHAQEWAINDVRWANIIFVQDFYGGKWWLIDCEHAEKFKTSFPRICTHDVNLGHICSASSDLALAGALFVEVQELVFGSNDLTRLQHVLQKSKKRPKTCAAELLELPWLKALRAPPSLSPGSEGELTGRASSSRIAARKRKRRHNGCNHHLVEYCSSVQ